MQAFGGVGCAEELGSVPRDCGVNDEARRTHETDAKSPRAKGFEAFASPAFARRGTEASRRSGEVGVLIAQERAHRIDGELFVEGVAAIERMRGTDRTRNPIERTPAASHTRCTRSPSSSAR